MAAWTWEEGGDLIALEIGHHEGRRGERAVVLNHIVHADIERFESGAIGAEIVTDRSNMRETGSDNSAKMFAMCLPG